MCGNPCEKVGVNLGDIGAGMARIHMEIWQTRIIGGEIFPKILDFLAKMIGNLLGYLGI